MLLHVTRDQAGRRRLSEIAILRRTDSGLVQAVPAWHVEYGMADGAADLRSLLESRMAA